MIFKEILYATLGRGAFTLHIFLVALRSNTCSNSTVKTLGCCSSAFLVDFEQGLSTGKAADYTIILPEIETVLKN